MTGATPKSNQLLSVTHPICQKSHQNSSTVFELSCWQTDTQTDRQAHRQIHNLLCGSKNKYKI